MKMKEEHIVPLSRQAIGILKELQTFTGRGTFLFPSCVPRSAPSRITR
jgi:integrase